jgi:hypothetical protein
MHTGQRVATPTQSKQPKQEATHRPSENTRSGLLTASLLVAKRAAHIQRARCSDLPGSACSHTVDQTEQQWQRQHQSHSLHLLADHSPT